VAGRDSGSCSLWQDLGGIVPSKMLPNLNKIPYNARDVSDKSGKADTEKH
jgi:hypothetical protein